MNQRVDLEMESKKKIRSADKRMTNLSMSITLRKSKRGDLQSNEPTLGIWLGMHGKNIKREI